MGARTRSTQLALSDSSATTLRNSANRGPGTTRSHNERRDGQPLHTKRGLSQAPPTEAELGCRARIETGRSRGASKTSWKPDERLGAIEITKGNGPEKEGDGVVCHSPPPRSKRHS